MELRLQNELLTSAATTLETLSRLQAQLISAQADLQAFGSPLREVEAAKAALEKLRLDLTPAPTPPAPAPVVPAPVQPAPVVEVKVENARKLFAVNPAFAADNLPEGKRKWHTQLLQALKMPTADPNARKIAGSSISELVGFTIKDYVVALASALDATGNVLFLREIIEVMEVLKKRQVFTIDSNKDRAFIASMYALVAYVTHVNRHLDAAVEAAAVYWNGELMELCHNDIPSDDLTHSYAASVETAWYLYLLTGESCYRVDAEQRRDELVRSITIGADQRAQWNHRPAFAASKSANTLQRTTYGRYVMQTMVMLKRTGLDTIPMASLVKTVLGIVRANGTISYLIDGTQEESVGKIPSSNWALLVPYDSSGELAKRLTAAVRAHHVLVPAGFLTVG